jgi:hypothetical protein
MAVSIIFFVLWEMTKMFITTKSLMNLSNEVVSAQQESFLAKLDELKIAEARLYLKLLPNTKHMDQIEYKGDIEIPTGWRSCPESYYSSKIFNFAKSFSTDPASSANS